jgi:hypothetical protein
VLQAAAAAVAAVRAEAAAERDAAGEGFAATGYKIQEV